MSGNSANDVLKEAGVQIETPQVPTPPPQVNVAEITSNFERQIAELKSQIDSTRKVDSDKLSKAIGFIEGSGIGRYDDTTGSFVQAKKESVDEVTSISQRIEEEKRSLRDRKKNGEIDADEYSILYEDTVGVLQERLFEAKTRKAVNEVSSNVRKEMSDNFSNQQQKLTVDQQFSQIAYEYPEVNDVNSDLFKEMNKIYTDPIFSATFSKANPSIVDKNPQQYKALVHLASQNLRLKGIEVSKQQNNSIKSNFYTPTNEGYSNNQQSKVYITSGDITSMRNMGITNDKVLKEIVDTLGSVDPYNIQGGHMVMEMDN